MSLFFCLLAATARNIKIRIAENAQENNDTKYLSTLENVDVKSLNFTNLMGNGILHTKLWISDRYIQYHVLIAIFLQRTNIQIHVCNYTLFLQDAFLCRKCKFWLEKPNSSQRTRSLGDELSNIGRRHVENLRSVLDIGRTKSTNTWWVSIIQKLGFPLSNIFFQMASKIRNRLERRQSFRVLTTCLFVFVFITPTILSSWKRGWYWCHYQDHWWSWQVCIHCCDGLLAKLFIRWCASILACNWQSYQKR